MSKPEYLDGLDLDSVDGDFDSADSEATKQNVRALIRLVLRTIKKTAGDDPTDAKEFTDTLLKQAKEEGRIQLSSDSSTLVPASSSDATPRMPADAAMLGTDLLNVFGGNLTRAQLAVEFFDKVMATGPDTLAYFVTVLDDLNRANHPDQVVRDNKVPTLRSVQTLREQKIVHESAMYDLLRAIHGGGFTTGTVQDMVDNATRTLARRAVTPTPLPAPPAAVGDNHYIRLLGIASGISEGSITDFGQYAQHVVDELNLRAGDANKALDAIGRKLATSRTSPNNDTFGKQLITALEAKLTDLATAQRDLKAKDTELNTKIGEFDDLKRKSDATRTRIIAIADKNDIAYNPGATPEKIVEEMIDQKGGTFSKLSQ